MLKATDKLLSIVSMLDDDGNVIEREPSRKYLLLANCYMQEEDSSDLEEFRTWDIIIGREETLEYIIRNYPNEYDDLVNPFTSVVISDSITMDKAVTFYSFVRMMIESKKISEDFWGKLDMQDITVDEWNDVVLNVYGQFASEAGIKTSEDLDKFYNSDI